MFHGNVIFKKANWLKKEEKSFDSKSNNTFYIFKYRVSQKSRRDVFLSTIFAGVFVFIKHMALQNYMWQLILFKYLKQGKNVDTDIVFQLWNC